MKQIRWRDFSLVSKIIIEVGMIAILLFSMNMLWGGMLLIGIEYALLCTNQ